MRLTTFICGLTIAILGGGCASGGVSGPRLHASPLSLICGKTLGKPDPSIDSKRFCLPADRIETWLKTAPIEILAVRRTFGGTSGAMQVQVKVPIAQGKSVTLLAKWKEIPAEGDGLNNSPRREIAAYELQKLFLDPSRYVVPPTVARCIPIASYRRFVPEAKPTFPEGKCVFGVLAYWLANVSHKNVYNRTMLKRNVRYRGHFADMNVFTYLADHRDSRGANFVASKDPRSPRVFAIDNGLAFSGSIRNPLAFVMTDWSELQRDEVLRKTWQALLKVNRNRLNRRLRVVAQFKLTSGQYRPTLTGSPRSITGFHRNKGLIQFGLTPAEIDGVLDRMGALLRRVERKEVSLF